MTTSSTATTIKIVIIIEEIGLPGRAYILWDRKNRHKIIDDRW